MVLMTSQSVYLEVKMQEDDHLPVAGLEERVLDVVVEDVDLVPPDGRVPEAVDVRLQHPGQPLLHNVGPDVQVLQLGVPLAGAGDEGVLLHEIGLLLVLGLPGLVLLLDVLDEAEGSVQVGAGGADLAGLSHVGAAVRPAKTEGDVVKCS